jgi:hypothetical protein
MREIRSSGLEGGVEFKPPSLPLFYSNDDGPIILFVFGTGARRAARSSVRSGMMAQLVDGATRPRKRKSPRFAIR